MWYPLSMVADLWCISIPSPCKTFRGITYLVCRKYEISAKVFATKPKTYTDRREFVDATCFECIYLVNLGLFNPQAYIQFNCAQLNTKHISINRKTRRWRTNTPHHHRIGRESFLIGGFRFHILWYAFGKYEQLIWWSVGALFVLATGSKKGGRSKMAKCLGRNIIRLCVFLMMMKITVLFVWGRI